MSVASKKLFLIISTSIFFSFFNLSAQNFHAIERFKTGVFIYENRDSSRQIIRTKKKQTEVFNEGKSKLVFDVEWTSDTTYLLRFKKSHNAPGCLQKHDFIAVIILSVDSDCYTCRFISNRCGEGTGVFYKID